MNVFQKNISLYAFFSIVVILIFSTIFSIVAIWNVGTYNSNRLLILLCEIGQKNLNNYIESIEKSVSFVSEHVQTDLKSLNSLDDFNSEKFSSLVEHSKSLFSNMKHIEKGVLSYFYRINPDISKTEKGYWFVNIDGNGFKEHEVTNISLYDITDMSKLVWYTVPKYQKKAIWLPPYITDNLGARVISYSVPIFFNEKFVGVIGIEIDYSTMAKLVNNISLHENGYAFINDDKGKIIYHPLMDVTKMKTQPSVPDGLLSNGEITLYNFNDKDKIGTWKKLSNGMRLNVSVPVSEINKDWQKWIYAIVAIAITLFILVFLLFINIRHILKLNYSAKIKNQKLKDRHQQLLDMINAMTIDYSGIYNVDLDLDDALCYRENNQTPEDLHYHYQSWITDYCNLYVDDNYKEDFLKFVNKDNIRLALSNQDIISYLYLVNRNGKSFHKLIRMACVYYSNNNNEKKVHSIALGFIDIDQEVREYTEK